MTERPRLPDFNAPRAPTAAKLTRFFTGLLWLLVGTQVGASLTNLAASILIAIAVSRPLRSGHGFWLELLLVALFFGAMSLIGWLGIRSMKSKWFSALYSGRPRFGSLKGPGKQGFQFILRCSGSMNLRFEPEIDRLIRKTGAQNVVQVERAYHYFYERAGFEEAGWPDTWEQIQHTEFAGVQYGEAIRSGRWDIFWLKYYVMLRLVLPLSLIYTAGTFWLLADAASGRSPLRLIQFALVVGVVIALVIFINYTSSLGVVTIAGKEQVKAIGVEEDLRSSDPEVAAAMRQIKESTQDSELEREVESYAGKEFYPKVGPMKPGYIESIRNEFARDFLVIGGVNVVMLCLLLVVQWPISRAFSNWSASQVDAWTVKMLVGTAAIPIALVATLVLGFIILSRFGRFAGVLATALLLAAVPPLITYVLRGTAGGTIVIISSLASAAIGALPSAIAELIKQKPNIGSAA